MLPAKAIEARHVQRKAIQHSNALSLGSHFNHSLFSATVTAGCKLHRAVINPCQVRDEEEGKTKGNELKYEVPLMIAPRFPSHSTSCYTRLWYIVLHSWRKSGTPKEPGSSYSTFMFLKPAKAPFVPLCSFSNIEQKRPFSVGGTKYLYICIHSIACWAHIVYGHSITLISTGVIKSWV